MTAVLASEWAEDRNGKKAIRVNAVAPGWILTNMVQDGYRLGVVSENQILAAVPFKRLANRPRSQTQSYSSAPMSPAISQDRHYS